MHGMLFVALVAVYLLGIAGVVAAGSLVGLTGDDTRPLEERLAVTRAASPDTPQSRRRVIESIDV
jgi:hypothetical protein